MTQLSYQPAFDAYNAIFRILQLQTVCSSSVAVPLDALRIGDFFLLFPFMLQDSDIRYRSGDQKIRSVGKKYEADRPFSRLPDKKTLFRRIRPFQTAAIAGLVHSGYMDAEKWDQRFILPTKRELPGVLKQRVAEKCQGNSALLEAIGLLLNEYPLEGKNGLKDRSSLLEYRYDLV
ncbi:ABC-three component system middle component 5 [Anderseniella sp. Alg231-50]|uniref:ABC-three component system middle component 5 n=1 Tax=Anderseniella sp. Alg231-50 TaxID=1922226 RepID=UPI000D54F742